MQLEVAFVASKGRQRSYLQSAFAITDEEECNRETKVFSPIGDSFKKIVVQDDLIPGTLKTVSCISVGINFS